MRGRCPLGGAAYPAPAVEGAEERLLGVGFAADDGLGVLAWREVEELRDEQRKTGSVARRDETVATIMQAFLDTPPASWRSPTTMRVGRQHIERIIAAVGTVPYVKFTPRIVETRLLAPMAKAGLSTSTIVQCKSIGARALCGAMRDGLVMRNAFELAETPRGTVRRSRSITRAQIASLLLLEMTPWWRAYLTVAIGCGLRLGELLRLRWADHDFEAGTLAVRRALHEEAGPDGSISLTLADLKTPSSRRTLRMPASPPTPCGRCGPPWPPPGSRPGIAGMTTRWCSAGRPESRCGRAACGPVAGGCASMPGSARTGIRTTRGIRS